MSQKDEAFIQDIFDKLYKLENKSRSKCNYAERLKDFCLMGVYIGCDAPDQLLKVLLNTESDKISFNSVEKINSELSTEDQLRGFYYLINYILCSEIQHNKPETLKEINVFPNMQLQGVLTSDDITELQQGLNINLSILLSESKKNDDLLSADEKNEIDTFLSAFTNIYAVVFDRCVQGVLMPLGTHNEETSVTILTSRIDVNDQVKILPYADYDVNNPFYKSDQTTSSKYQRQLKLFWLSLRFYFKIKPLKFSKKANAPYDLEKVNGTDILKTFVETSSVNFIPNFHAMCSQRLIYGYATKDGEGIDWSERSQHGVKIVPCSEFEAKERHGGVYKATSMKELKAFAESTYLYFYKQLRTMLTSTNMYTGDKKISCLQDIGMRLTQIMTFVLLAIDISESSVEFLLTMTPETVGLVNSKLIDIKLAVDTDNTALNSKLKYEFVENFIQARKKQCVGTAFEDAPDELKTQFKLVRNVDFKEMYAANLSKYCLQVGLTPDFSKYVGIPEFAWKKFRDYYTTTDPGFDNILLGRLLNGKSYRVNISSVDALLGFSLFAGSRAGKGVQTLSWLSSFIGMGCPLLYLDGKPDMAIVLKQLESVWSVATGKDLRILTYDWTTDVPGADDVIKPFELSIDGQKTDNRLQLKDSTYRALRVLKLLYLFAAWNKSAASKTVRGGKPLKAIAVLDEMVIASAAFKSAFSDIKDVCMYLIDKYKSAKGDPAAQEKISSTLSYFKTLLSMYFVKQSNDKTSVEESSKKESQLTILFDNLIAESLGRTQSKFIFISQRTVSFNKMTFSNVYPSFLHGLMSKTILIKGKNSITTAGDAVYNAVSDADTSVSVYVTGASKSTKSLVQEESANCTGYFAVKTAGIDSADSKIDSGNSTWGEHWTVYKPYLTLNENDIANPNNNKFTEGCKGVIANSGLDVDSIVNSEFYRPDGTVENRVGFQGLCEYMFAILYGKTKGLSLAEIDNLYCTDTEFVKEIQNQIVDNLMSGVNSLNAFISESVCDAGGNPVYKDVFDYINDFSSNSLWLFNMSTMQFNQASGICESNLDQIGDAVDDMYQFDLNDVETSDEPSVADASQSVDSLSDISVVEDPQNNPQNNPEEYFQEDLQEEPKDDFQDDLNSDSSEDIPKNNSTNFTAEDDNALFGDSSNTSIHAVEAFNKLHKPAPGIDTAIDLNATMFKNFVNTSGGNINLAFNLTKHIFLPLVKKYFGDFSEIRTVSILYDNQIMLNDILFKPTIHDSDILNPLPLAYKLNILSNKWAGMIDLSVIPKKFVSITRLEIENDTFAEDVVKCQLGLSRNDSWSELFYISNIKDLKTIIIGGMKITSADEANNYAEWQKQNSLWPKLKNCCSKVFPNKNSENDAPMSRFWKNPSVKAVTTAAKYTLGAKAVLTASMALGGWGLLFGALAVGGVIKHYKSYSTNHKYSGRKKEVEIED